MKGSGTRLRSSIANCGMGRRTLKETPDKTNWFDKTNKVTDKTENTPSIMNLSEHRLLSVESLQQFIETNTICSTCNEKLRLQSYNNAYKQGGNALSTSMLSSSMLRGILTLFIDVSNIDYSSNGSGWLLDNSSCYGIHFVASCLLCHSGTKISVPLSVDFR